MRSPSVPPHVSTARHLAGAYPFLRESELGAGGTFIGVDLLGGSFCYDPFVLYEAGLVTNPNMVVLGQIGRGKSSLVKSYLWRQSVFGRRCWVVDPKGEYGPLALACGVEPVRLEPGGSIRLNPLDDPSSYRDTGTGHAARGGELLGRDQGLAPGGNIGHVGQAGEADEAGRVEPGVHAILKPDTGVTFKPGRSVTPRPEESITLRRVALLSAILTASLGRSLLPAESGALDLAVRDAQGRHRQPVIPHVIEALFAPTFASAAALRTEIARLTEDGRQVALELRRLTAGDLRGMFDGPTSEGINMDGQVVVLDLSAIYNSPALGILMTCAMGWLQGALERPGAERVLFVVDEAWAVLRNPGVARWLHDSWKLARARGTSNIAVVHRPSDLAAVGPGDGEHMHLARGLLSDSETRVVYAQSPGEAEMAAGLLDLTPTETEIIKQLGRGIALWKVGNRSFLVRHEMVARELEITQTDGAMKAHYQ